MKPNITSGHCHHLSAVTGGRLNLDASQSRSTTTRQAAVCRIVKDGEEMEQRALEHNDVHSSELADQGLGRRVIPNNAIRNVTCNSLAWRTVH